MHIGISANFYRMAKTSYTESLKYGGRLFGFFLGITLAGGTALAVGGWLAISELQSFFTSGTAETVYLSGGVVVMFFGMVILVCGNFALVYKLIADAVNQGNASPRTISDPERISSEDSTDEASAEGSELFQQTDEQPDGTEPTPDERDQPGMESRQIPSNDPDATEPQPTGPDQQPAGTAGEVNSDSPTVDAPAEPDAPESESQGPAVEGSQPTQPSDPVENPPSQRKERTAEEIAFGTSGETRESEQGTGETQPTDQERDHSPEEPQVEDEEWFDSADEPEGRPADPDEPPEDDVDRSEMETAGNSSSDPLSEEFENEQ